MSKDHSFIKIFLTLFISVFVTTMGASIIGPLLPVYAHQLGAGPFQIGLIFGAFSFTRSIFVPFFGKLSERKGKKTILICGLLIYLLLSVLYSMTKDVWHLIFLRLTQGFASAMILPVAQAYVGIITPERYEGRIMGLFNTSLYGGLSLGPVVGGFVKDHSDIRYSFLSMGVLASVGFFLCFFFLPPRKNEPKADRNPEKTSYLKLLRDPTLFSLFFFRICFTSCIGIIWTFLPLIATLKLGLSSTAIGLLLSIHVIVSCFFQTPMGYLADRFSKKSMIITGGAIGIISLLALTKAKGFLEIAFINALLGIASAFSIPSLMAISVIEGRKKNAMGSIMALMAQAHSIGMLFGPVMTGIFIEVFSLEYTFFVATFILAFATAVTGILISEKSSSFSENS